ncbi:Hsp70 family protein [Actinoplanes sp. NPDC023714]|uniref:Hsp70 family protein n=1 Tax=Actinoplanes sp. NPDC023714 TaxID=3154322 RepID=UPI0033DEAE1A
MTADYGLGIDLGTTHTAAAVLADGRVESARLGARRWEIPSAIFVKEDGGLLVGEAAERRGQDEPARLAREFKRRLGDPVPVIVGGVPLSTLTLTAKLLRYVLDTVTAQRSAPPAQVAITHPAHWGPYKRDQLDQAIRLADAGPVRLLSEPEAVARRHAAAGRVGPGETVAVYDLGGSSFDVAVIRRDGDEFTLLGTPEGVDQLGGGDFDEAVYAHVLDALGGVDLRAAEDPETAAALARLRRDCVEAKESLSFDTEVTVPVALPGRHTRVRINRSAFEALIALPVRDTLDATRRALRSAGIPPEDLAGILLAGGSSRIPLITSVLERELGRPVLTDSHPELSVALGAASTSARPFRGTPEAAVPAGPLPADPHAAGSPPVGAESIPDVSVSAGPVPTGGDASEISRRESAIVAPNGGPPTRTSPTEPARTGAVSPAGGGSPAARLGLSVRPAPKQDFTELRTPADPWAAVEAAEAEAARTAAAEAADAAALRAAAADSEVAGATVPVSPASGGVGEEHEPSTAVIRAGHATGTPYGRKALTARRRRTVTIAGVAVVAVAAAATGIVLSNLHDDNRASGAGPTAAPSSAVAGPAALPAQKLVIRTDTGGSMGSATWVTRIRTLDPVSGARQDLAGTEPGDTLPRWSNDRSRIALTHRDPDRTNAIYVMDRTGADRRLLVDDVSGGRVVWSPDDQRLAYVKKSQLFTIPAGGGEPTQLTTSNAPKDDPIWSADGRSIIYWAEEDGVRSLFALNVADPQEPGERITKADLGDAMDPAISPDGSQILFTRKIDSSNYDIWQIGADGSRPKAVTNDEAREMDPTWSPDGEWFAYVRGDLDHPKVYVERRDGSGEQPLTRGSDREGHPCWF